MIYSGYLELIDSDNVHLHSLDLSFHLLSSKFPNTSHYPNAYCNFPSNSTLVLNTTMDLQHARHARHVRRNYPSSPPSISLRPILLHPISPRPIFSHPILLHSSPIRVQTSVFDFTIQRLDIHKMLSLLCLLSNLMRIFQTNRLIEDIPNQITSLLGVSFPLLLLLLLGFLCQTSAFFVDRKRDRCLRCSSH